MGLNDNLKSNSYIYKWDYRYFDFQKLDFAFKNSNNRIGVNYGHKYSNIEEAKTKISSSALKETDVIYVMFTNVPGSDSQIYLRLSDFKFKAEKDHQFHDELTKKDEYFYEGMIENGIQKYQKVAYAKVEWVLNEENPLQFTVSNIKTNYKGYQDRPPQQLIQDLNLKNDLDKYLHSYDKFREKMKKVSTCAFCDMKSSEAKSVHAPFTTRLNLPYVEGHHFVLQSIYKKFYKEYKEINLDCVKELEHLIYSTNNIILVCPRCHRKLHQGLENEVSEMIHFLLKEKKGVNEVLLKVVDFLNEHDQKIEKDELISAMYHIKFKS